MFEVTFPSNTEEVIDSIRAAIGREVVFYTQTTLSGCSSCSLDPISRKSTDSFCSVCGGDYFVPVYAAVSVSGHVTWKDTGIMDWTTGGQLFEGDCRIQIKYTPRNLNLVTASGYVIVDGKTMDILSRAYKGVPELNRIIVNLELKEGK